MKKTKIEWADSTWNPVTGCFHGCEYCYGKRIAERFGGSIETCPDGTLHELEEKFYADPSTWVAKQGENLFRAYPWGFDPTFHKYRLHEPQRWKEPRKIFVCSMADLFGEWVPDEWIDEVFKACEEAPQHTYLFLTKNPSRYCKLDDAGKLPHKKNWWYGSTWTKPGDCVLDSSRVTMKDSFHTFLSIEPLLGSMEHSNGIVGFNWIIIGAESGNRKEKVTPKKEWIEKICQFADQSAAPVFMKNSLIPIVGEENMRREFPQGLKKDKEAGGA